MAGEYSELTEKFSVLKLLKRCKSIDASKKNHILIDLRSSS